MPQEERFDVGRGFQGCMAACACLVVFSLSISLVLTEWLGLISVDTERILLLFMWLIAICLGGYVAARLGKTTGWSNSLVVGVIAVLMVWARLPNEGLDKTYWDPFLEIMKDPGAHWQNLTRLALTIPVAILGGVIWEKTGRVQSAAIEESKNRIEEE